MIRNQDQCLLNDKLIYDGGNVHLIIYLDLFLYSIKIKNLMKLNISYHLYYLEIYITKFSVLYVV